MDKGQAHNFQLVPSSRAGCSASLDLGTKPY